MTSEWGQHYELDTRGRMVSQRAKPKVNHLPKVIHSIMLFATGMSHFLLYRTHPIIGKKTKFS